MSEPSTQALSEASAPFPDRAALSDLAARVRSLTGFAAAVVALADPENGWGRASSGVEEEGDGTVLTSLALQTLLRKRPWLVTDCLEDGDLRLHPSVVGRPWLRSLAGFPLIASGGRVLGALCALGFDPASLDEGSRQAMEALVRSLVQEIQRLGLDLERRRLGQGPAASPLPSIVPARAELVERERLLEAMEATFSLGVARGFSVLRLECRDLDRLTASLGVAGTAALMETLMQRILTLLPDQTSVCRYSEEEFLIVIPQLADPGVLALVAQRLLGVGEWPIRIAGRELPVVVAIGATVVDGSQTCGAAVLSEAGLARRLAAEPGGSAYRLLDGSIRRQLHDEFARQSHFREALLHGALVPHFQPIVDLRQGRPLGFEALARWHGSGGRIEEPSEFLPLARQMGLISELDLAVIDKVLAALPAFAAIQATTGEAVENDALMVMSVNLSAQTLDDPGQRQQLLHLLEHRGIPAGWKLQVEILEETLQDTSSDFDGFLSRLAVLNVAIAIDDFGTGYSSLARLDQLPIQGFKVDRSFVERIDDGLSPSNQLLRTMNSLAIDLGLSTTAEGVGTEQQREWLQNQGFVSGQGFHFSHPLPLEKALDYLREQASRGRDQPAGEPTEADPNSEATKGARRRGVLRALAGWLAGRSGPQV
jgi:EAL domain-containing protein (putative c-di-GMP-specific phosphodiesterase class I)/GGDEF domain-containing protein